MYLGTAWEQEARIDAARELTEATFGQFDQTPTDKDVQLLVDEMTLESWGMTYAVDEVTVIE